ncbi:elongation factor 1-gamma [Senna tora]|uniref:Elongation factor 1-gamma n=1 Tax=Senna tora TaxID=362788 RepID=A0A834TNA7_9FABA|nr:elongation factor 1-gamma [Senna tora]
MALVLHAGSTNKNAFKTLIAAEYSGVKVELVKNFEMGVSNKTPEFLKMNPIGKVPVLETPDGPIFESNAIARYVTRSKADNPLFGSSLIEYAHIEQWIDFASLEIDANILRWFVPRAGFAAYLPPAEEAAISALKRALDALNTHLASNTYLVGHHVTLADIILTCNLSLGFAKLMTKSFTSEFPHVERYFWTMVNQPNFKKILGEVKQTESVLPIQSAKKPSQPKEPAKTKAKAEKEEKKEPAKPKAQEAGEEEEAPKPKPKNPLDLLPPSKMIMDEWKRLYSNTKSNFREVAIKGFWDMYDPEGYSLWFCDYKYNDENTVSFVTLNKVSGFLQRMDLARKYAFGKMLIIGSEPPFKVKGLWLFRGKEIPQFVLDECYDMELYEWTKVDITDEAQKERVSQMIEDHEPFEGQALLDAKCFNFVSATKLTIAIHMEAVYASHYLCYLPFSCLCKLCVLEGLSNDPSDSKNENKDKSHGGGLRNSVGFKIIIVCLILVTFIAFCVFLFKLWQKKKRAEQHARLLKLFEEDDELEVELGMRE